jgi:hypothetical protein
VFGKFFAWELFVVTTLTAVRANNVFIQPTPGKYILIKDWKNWLEGQENDSQCMNYIRGITLTGCIYLGTKEEGEDKVNLSTIGL